MQYPTSDNSFSCCGCAIVCPRMDYFYSYYSMANKLSSAALRHMRDLPYRYIMTNQFAGFDKPIHTQPNLCMTGPTLDPDLTDARDFLDRECPDVVNFMNQAMENNEPVVYVSLGNSTKWQQWYIDTIY